VRARCRERSRTKHGKREGGSGENTEQDQSPSNLLQAQKRFAQESLRVICAVRC